MSHSSFRFLHASDLHLERPLGGTADAPEALRPLCLEAPYRAAERMFAAALQEKVEFVLLAGDVLQPALCGPRGVAFLLDQFQRLADAGIRVYWAGGQVDPPSAWPQELPLPSNVRVFPQGRTEAIVHERGGVPLCNILGAGSSSKRINPGDFRLAGNGRLNIAVAHGQAELAALKEEPISYWALGGKHSSATHTGRRMVHYPGATQGRNPQETGAHGCTVVEVDAEGRFHIHRRMCDVARWQTLEIRVDEHTRRDQLEELLREQMSELLAREAGCELLITWNIVGSGPLWTALRRGSLATEIASTLQRQFLARRDRKPLELSTESLVWTVGLMAQPPAYHADAVVDQETLLGDFLRLVRQHQADDKLPLDLESLLECSPQEAPRSMWKLSDPATRQEVLRDAAALGVEVLEGAV